MISTPADQLSDGQHNDSMSVEQKENHPLDIRIWEEEMILDFAAFDSSIIRAQYVQTSNERERARYATQRVEIGDAAQSMRQSITDLRVQLQHAQATLALRKTYDDLAAKILSNRMLRTREDQATNIAKLNEEIGDLQRESQDYMHTWSERRQQFTKIVDEGMTLRRLIRDETEEVERREGMQGQDGYDVASKSGTINGADHAL